MSEATRWPIDYESLAKGDVIPVERLEAVFGVKYGTEKYSFSCLKLKGQIEARLRDFGKLFTVKLERGAIRVLPDAEASPYTTSRQRQARRSMVKNYALQSAVDVSHLTHDQRAQHDRELEMNGKYIQAMSDIKQRIAASPSRRSVPGLLGTSE